MRRKGAAGPTTSKAAGRRRRSFFWSGGTHSRESMERSGRSASVMFWIVAYLLGAAAAASFLALGADDAKFAYKIQHSVWALAGLAAFLVFFVVPSLVLSVSARTYVLTNRRLCSYREKPGRFLDASAIVEMAAAGPPSFWSRWTSCPWPEIRSVSIDCGSKTILVRRKSGRAIELLCGDRFNEACSVIESRAGGEGAVVSGGRFASDPRRF